MGNIKILKEAQQLISKAKHQVPKLNKVFSKHYKKFKQAIKDKENWKKIARGSITGLAVTDSINQRVKRKQEEVRNAEQGIKQAQVICKQDAEINVLKKEKETSNERFDDLKAYNEQLCNALNDLMGDNTENEEIEEIEETDDSNDGTTDK